MKFTARIDTRERQIELTRNGAGWECRVDGQLRALDVVEAGQGRYSIVLEGESFEVHIEDWSGSYRVHTGGADLIVEVDDPRRWSRRGGAGASGSGRQEITASMPGKVIRVLVEEGQQVESGQGLVVVEAMKMQNEIPAPRAGVVERILVEAGETVEHGAPLVVVE